MLHHERHHLTADLQVRHVAIRYTRSNDSMSNPACPSSRSFTVSVAIAPVDPHSHDHASPRLGGQRRSLTGVVSPKSLYGSRRPGTHLAAFSSVDIRPGIPPSSALRSTHLNDATAKELRRHDTRVAQCGARMPGP